METSQASNDGVLTQDHNNNLPHMPATNGHNWDELKSMLSFQLKQVLSEYPEATKSDDQQNSSIGECYPELVQRFEAALFSFIEGPPFTLQRLCEILLNARTIYPNLSKLALALEKNLLVTSTITKSTDPYPSSLMQVPNATEEHVENALPQPQDPQQQPQPQPQPEQPQTHSNSAENGGEPTTGDGDEVMSEADTHVHDGMTIDVETFQEIISSSEGNPEPSSDS